MSTAADDWLVHFPEGYNAQREHETPWRGYLSDVVVELGDGSRYRLFFMDPVRLQQELADQVQQGQPYLAEPNLVVLPEVTTAAIHKAVEQLVEDHYFQDLKSL